ncbi:MAG: YbaB/EbfC family nucleoid-associated protein [Gammaproteobacteria bacterium]
MNLANLLEQAKKMQSEMEKLQKSQGDKLFTGEAGGGLVKVTLNGLRKVIDIHFDSEFRQEDDIIIKDLIKIAFNNALEKVEADTQGQLSGLTSQFMPGGLKLPSDN